ncbi:AraC family transcriptional regulator [Neisseria sicca]|uniref:AraC family transcriptional regulator n=1 Tax=Neisseria sicca TaxID=490 RepID=UPI0021BE8164|nr:AraC family transcriptional regulator [Neisseria sicca]
MRQILFQHLVHHFIHRIADWVFSDDLCLKIRINRLKNRLNRILTPYSSSTAGRLKSLHQLASHTAMPLKG